MSQSRAGESGGSVNADSSNAIPCDHLSNVTNLGSAGERAEILAWLSPLDPWIRHHDIREHGVEHVGDWLLRTEEYRSWFDGIHGEESENSALFCYGDPGAGKTYISSLVINTLCDWAKGRNAALACFYFDFTARKGQSPTIVLSSLLKQIVGGLKEVPAKIVEAFRDQRKTAGGRRLRLGQVVEMLQDISSSLPTFICIDAIDECMDEYRSTLLESLKHILQKSPSTRIFLAGRLHIQDEVDKHLGGRLAAVSITPTKFDIIRFLRAKLKADSTPDAMDKSLEEDIIKNIPEKISELFLLVSLNIEAILLETTLHRRREKLDTMTNGLGDAYDATIGRIKAQREDEARLGMATLMWISYSERPLSVDEICHALAVEVGSTDINADNVPSIQTVLSCCQGLAVVDKRSSTIRLIHFTLTEYLSRHADMFDGAHSKIAETCLTYLNFEAIKKLTTSSSRDLGDMSILRYASLYWGTHMRMELSDRSRRLARDLLDKYDNHISAKLLWASTTEWSFRSKKPFSALHCVSYFGIAEIAIELIGTKRWDVNERDSAGLTPLMWAAKCGREEVVELLLRQKHTQPDIPDMRYGRTALSWAAGCGREGVVRLFLSGLFVNPGSLGRQRGTPHVMSVLFGRKYVNPDRPDSDGRTPLSWAAGDGCAGLAKLLLEREDVILDRPDNDGRTPFSWAARNGRDEVVELLLERKDVSPDRPDSHGRTPLWWAASNSCWGVMKLLLDREDVHPDTPDSDGRTPLLWAAENGREGVLKLLVTQKDINPDRPGNDGRTPLWWTVRNRCEEAVKLFLEREDVSPDKQDNHGKTPLSVAAEDGCEELVKLLLEREDISPDRPDSSGRTPLLWAAQNSCGRVVKLLLEREDVNPDKPDNDGRTPLWWSAWNRCGGVAKLLLGREDVSPNKPDNRGRTPLSVAAEDGCESLLKLLLEREDISPDKPDNDGRTPLSWAAENERSRVVKLLLEREDVSPDGPDNRGRAPLSWAAEKGCEGVVKLLLEREGITPGRVDIDGRTPLWRATREGHQEVVKLLSERTGVSSNNSENDALGSETGGP